MPAPGSASGENDGSSDAHATDCRGPGTYASHWPYLVAVPGKEKSTGTRTTQYGCRAAAPSLGGLNVQRFAAAIETRAKLVRSCSICASLAMNFKLTCSVATSPTLPS